MTEHQNAVRRFADCEIALLIVYTLSDDAIDRGYETWLDSDDNPFFNAIPGVCQYTNWKTDRVSSGTVDGWTHFDFLGMRRREDFEKVWFNPDLNRFRADWVKRWGPPRGAASELYGHTYLMEAPSSAQELPKDRAIFSFGEGTPPDASQAWRVTHAVRKHFVADMADRSGPWMIPAAEFNPLGHDWFAMGTAQRASVVLEATRIAGPD